MYKGFEIKCVGTLLTIPYTCLVYFQEITDPPKELEKELISQQIATEDFFVLCPGVERLLP